MGFFDFFRKKMNVVQGKNNGNINFDDKQNRKRIEELFRHCSQNDLILMGKVTHGMNLNDNEINEIVDQIKNKPVIYRELWVRLAVMVGLPGIIEYATDDELREWFGLK